MKKIIIVLIALIALSCNKETQNSPSFSLKINGVPWNVGTTPSNFGFAQPLTVYYNENKGLFQIQAESDSKDKGKDEKFFNLICDNIYEGGQFKIRSYMNYSDNLNSCKNWGIIDTTSNYKSFIKINSINNVNKKIAGEFQFRILMKGCTPETLDITEGIFNCNYQ